VEILTRDSVEFEVRMKAHYQQLRAAQDQAASQLTLQAGEKAAPKADTRTINELLGFISGQPQGDEKKPKKKKKAADASGTKQQQQKATKSTSN
jgi:hypothetical protein